MSQTASIAATDAANQVTHIVVFGGGFCGTEAFRQLHQRLQKAVNVHVTLVSASPYFYFNCAVPRALVEPKTSPPEKLFHRLSNVLPEKKIKETDRWHIATAVVAELHSDHALLTRSPTFTATGSTQPVGNGAAWGLPERFVKSVSDDSCEIVFDYAVLAFGSTSAFPAKQPVHWSHTKTIDEFKKLQGRVEKAQKISVLGAGILGLEYSGEIKTTYPGKEVSLIGPTVIAPTPAFAKKATAILERKGIRLLAKQKVDQSKIEFVGKAAFQNDPNASDSTDPVTFTTEATQAETESVTVTSDLVLAAVGVSPLSGPIKITGAVNEKGFVNVNAHMQVTPAEPNTPCPHIFCGGDLAANNTMKTIFPALKQAEIIASNIALLIKAGKSRVSRAHLKQFKAPPPMLIVPIGNDDGVSILPLFGSCFSKKIVKSFKGDGGFSLGKKRMGPNLAEENVPDAKK